MEEVKCVDVTILESGDIVFYYNLDDNGKAIMDRGEVRGGNPYIDGVTVYGDGWKQYVSKWFISEVEREGVTIYEQEGSE